MKIQNTPFRSHPFKRGVAIITTALFLSTELLNFVPAAWATHSIQVPEVGPSKDLSRLVREAKIRIPSELGTIEEVYSVRSKEDGDKKSGTPYASRRTFVFIQDAHDSLEAQENIAKIINHLVENYGVKTVFEEGYEGPVPTDKYFGFIQGPELKQKVAYFFLDHLRLGGAEYAHINRSKDFELIGADSLKLHKENIEQYRLSDRKKEAITHDLKALQKEIQFLADTRFPKQFLEWMKLKERFDAKKLDLFTYLGRTIALLKVNSPPFPKGDRGGFFKSPPAPLYKRGENLPIPLLQFVVEAIKSNDPVVIEKAKHIDAREVFEELIKLETSVGEAYLKTDTEKQLFDYWKILNLLERLKDLQVTQEEYEALLGDRVQGIGDRKGLESKPYPLNPKLVVNTQGMAQFIHKQTQKTLVLSKMWERNIQDAVKFYEIAQQRDSALSKMLDKYFSADRVEGIEYRINSNRKNLSPKPYPLIPEIAVLVFGGFHKENIKRILESKEINYLVVSPRITKPSPRHEEFYKRLMTDGRLSFEFPAPLGTATRAESRIEVWESMSSELTRAELRTLTAIAATTKADPASLVLAMEHALKNSIQMDRSEMRRINTGQDVGNSEIRRTLTSKRYPLNPNERSEMRLDSLDVRGQTGFAGRLAGMFEGGQAFFHRVQVFLRGKGWHHAFHLVQVGFSGKGWNHAFHLVQVFLRGKGWNHAFHLVQVFLRGKGWHHAFHLVQVGFSGKFADFSFGSKRGDHANHKFNHMNVFFQLFHIVRKALNFFKPVAYVRQAFAERPELTFEILKDHLDFTFLVISCAIVPGIFSHKILAFSDFLFHLSFELSLGAGILALTSAFVNFFFYNYYMTSKQFRQNSEIGKTLTSKRYPLNPNERSDLLVNLDVRQGTNPSVRRSVPLSRAEMRSTEALGDAKISGSIIAVNLLDLAAEVVDDNNGIGGKKKIIYRNPFQKLRELLPVFKSQGFQGIYLYGGLYDPSELSKKVHTRPDGGEHFVSSRNATVRVAGYPGRKVDYEDLTLDDSHGNAFSIDSLLEFDKKEAGKTFQLAKKLGMEVTVDFIPWLSPDAINETNYQQTFYLEMRPEWNEHFRSLDEDQHDGKDGKKQKIEALLRLCEGWSVVRLYQRTPKERVILVKLRGDAADQVYPNPFHPGLRAYYQAAFKQLSDLGVDAVRMDLPHWLFKDYLRDWERNGPLFQMTRTANSHPDAIDSFDRKRWFNQMGIPIPEDESFDPWYDRQAPPLQTIIREAKKYNPNLGFIMEVYTDLGGGGEHREAHREGGDLHYSNEIFKALWAIYKEGQPASILMDAIKDILFRKPEKGVIYGSNFDQNSLKLIAGDAATAVQMLLATLAHLRGSPVMVDFRDYIGHSGNIAKLPGSTPDPTAHDHHPFATPEELEAAYTDFSKLRQLAEESPWGSMMQKLAQVVPTPGQTYFEVLPTNQQGRYLAMAWRTPSGDWIVNLLDMKPSSSDPEILIYWNLPQEFSLDHYKIEAEESASLSADKDTSVLKLAPSGTFATQHYELIRLNPNSRSEVRHDLPAPHVSSPGKDYPIADGYHYLNAPLPLARSEARFQALMGSDTQNVFTQLLQGGDLETLSAGARQVLKMMIYEAIEMEVRCAQETLKTARGEWIPVLEHLETLGEKYPMQSAEFTSNEFEPENEALSHFFNEIGSVPAISGSTPEQGYTQIKLHSAILPVLYLNILMHIRLGVIHSRYHVSFIVDHPLNNEALFLLAPPLFLSKKVPQQRFDRDLNADTISIANAYQFQNGADVSTYFSTLTPSWILTDLQEKKNEQEPAHEANPDELLSIMLRAQLEWIGFGTLISRDAEAHAAMAEAYRDVLKNFREFYTLQKNHSDDPLLNAQEIRLLVGGQDVFEKSIHNSEPKLKVEASLALEKLRKHFYDLANKKSASNYVRLVQSSLEMLREEAYTELEDQGDAFEQAFSGPEHLMAPRRSELRPNDKVARAAAIAIQAAFSLLPLLDEIENELGKDTKAHALLSAVQKLKSFMDPKNLNEEAALGQFFEVYLGFSMLPKEVQAHFVKNLNDLSQLWKLNRPLNLVNNLSSAIGLSMRALAANPEKREAFKQIFLKLSRNDLNGFAKLLAAFPSSELPAIREYAAKHFPKLVIPEKTPSASPAPSMETVIPELTDKALTALFVYFDALAVELEKEDAVLRTSRLVEPVYRLVVRKSEEQLQIEGALDSGLIYSESKKISDKINARLNLRIPREFLDLLEKLGLHEISLDIDLLKQEQLMKLLFANFAKGIGAFIKSGKPAMQISNGSRLTLEIRDQTKILRIQSARSEMRLNRYSSTSQPVSDVTRGAEMRGDDPQPPQPVLPVHSTFQRRSESRDVWRIKQIKQIGKTSGKTLEKQSGKSVHEELEEIREILAWSGKKFVDLGAIDLGLRAIPIPDEILSEARKIYAGEAAHLLARIRENLGMTHKEMGIRLGMSDRQVKRREKGWVEMYLLKKARSVWDDEAPRLFSRIRESLGMSREHFTDLMNEKLPVGAQLSIPALHRMETGKNKQYPVSLEMIERAREVYHEKAGPLLRQMRGDLGMSWDDFGANFYEGRRFSGNYIWSLETSKAPMPLDFLPHARIFYKRKAREILVEVRKAIGLSQPQLAWKLNLPSNLISNWESQDKDFEIPHHIPTRMIELYRQEAQEKLSRIRKVLGLTLKQFAEKFKPKLKFHFVTLRRWELGRQPVLSLDILPRAKEIYREEAGKTIRKIREMLGMSLKEFAKLLEEDRPVNFRRLSQWETGTQVPIGILERVQKIVNRVYAMPAVIEKVYGEGGNGQRRLERYIGFARQGNPIAEVSLKELTETMAQFVSELPPEQRLIGQELISGLFDLTEGDGRSLLVRRQRLLEGIAIKTGKLGTEVNAVLEKLQAKLRGAGFCLQRTSASPVEERSRTGVDDATRLFLGSGRFGYSAPNHSKRRLDATTKPDFKALRHDEMRGDDPQPPQPVLPVHSTFQQALKNSTTPTRSESRSPELSEPGTAVFNMLMEAWKAHDTKVAPTDNVRLNSQIAALADYGFRDLPYREYPSDMQALLANIREHGEIRFGEHAQAFQLQRTIKSREFGDGREVVLADRGKGFVDEDGDGIPDVLRLVQAGRGRKGSLGDIHLGLSSFIVSMDEVIIITNGWMWVKGRQPFLTAGCYLRPEASGPFRKRWIGTQLTLDEQLSPQGTMIIARKWKHHTGYPDSKLEGLNEWLDRLNRSEMRIAFENTNEEMQHESDGQIPVAGFHRIIEELFRGKDFLAQTLRSVLPEQDITPYMAADSITIAFVSGHGETRIYSVVVKPASAGNPITFGLSMGQHSRDFEWREMAKYKALGKESYSVEREFYNLKKMHEALPRNVVQPYVYAEIEASGLPKFPLFSVQFVSGHDGIFAVHTGDAHRLISQKGAQPMWQMQGKDFRTFLKHFFKLQIQLFLKTGEVFYVQLGQGDLMYPGQAVSKSAGHPYHFDRENQFKTVAFNESNLLILTSGRFSMKEPKSFLVRTFFRDEQVVNAKRRFKNDPIYFSFSPEDAVPAFYDAMEELFPGEGKIKTVEWLEAYLEAHGLVDPPLLLAFVKRFIQKLNPSRSGMRLNRYSSTSQPASRVGRRAEMRGDGHENGGEAGYRRSELRFPGRLWKWAAVIAMGLGGLFYFLAKTEAGKSLRLRTAAAFVVRKSNARQREIQEASGRLAKVIASTDARQRTTSDSFAVFKAMDVLISAGLSTRVPYQSFEETLKTPPTVPGVYVYEDHASTRYVIVGSKTRQQMTRHTSGKKPGVFEFWGLFPPGGRFVSLEQLQKLNLKLSPTPRVRSETRSEEQTPGRSEMQDGMKKNIGYAKIPHLQPAARQRSELRRMKTSKKPAVLENGLSLQDIQEAVIAAYSEMRQETVPGVKRSESGKRSEIRSASMKTNVVLLLVELATLEAMRPEEFKAFLALARIRSEIRWVIPDREGGQSPRVQALKSMAKVDCRLPEIARAQKVPVLGFALDSQSALKERLIRLGDQGQEMVRRLGECFTLKDGILDGILLGLLVSQPEDLPLENGLRRDVSGRFQSKIQNFINGLIQNFVVISAAA